MYSPVHQWSVHDRNGIWAHNQAFRSTIHRNSAVSLVSTRSRAEQSRRFLVIAPGLDSERKSIVLRLENLILN